MEIEILIRSLDGKVKKTINARTAPKGVCGDLEVVDWKQVREKWPHMKDIPFPSLKSRQVDIMLGVECSDITYSIREIVGRDPGTEPIVRLTPLGFTAISARGHSTEIKERSGMTYSLLTRDISTRNFLGFEEPNRETRLKCFNKPMVKTEDCCFVTTEQDPEQDLTKIVKPFWEIDSMGITPTTNRSPSEEKAHKKVESSLKMREDGHYEVAVPWKDEQPQLPNNYVMAEKRLASLERRLTREPQVAQQYQEVIDDYEKKGYIRKVLKDEEISQGKWFLPHFPVVKPERETTKVRIVFDASARFQGVSLNDVALTGPKLQTDIFDILVRFRKELIALVGDISQMYHQLAMRESDIPFHRFLWRKLETHREPDVYEFLRFIFGGTYGPYCAQYTWQTHAHIHKDEYPDAAETVCRECYMDDLIASRESPELARELRHQLQELGELANFHIGKWLSNCAEVLEGIPDRNLAKEIDLERGKLPVTKTLGVMWITQSDQFTFKSQGLNEEFAYTKRNVLKKTARVFDPLGLLSPFILRAKILMQTAWREELEWDEILPEDMQKEWHQWWQELEQLHSIQIPRCIRVEREVSDISIHTFCDASTQAYAAASYARCEYSDETVSVRLIAAKVRLAPLKELSIPRLELMAAVIGTRLTIKISEALDISMKKVTLWSDSCNALCWIKNQSRKYMQFVANRVGEIQEVTQSSQWRYVNTNYNPADHATRSKESISMLAKDELWWNGPSYLTLSEQEWPVWEVSGLEEDVSCEMKKEFREKESCQVTVSNKSAEWRLNPERYSNWYNTEKNKLGHSLVRIRAWVRRAVSIWKNYKRLSQRNRQVQIEELKPEELAKSENEIIQESQRKFFEKEWEQLKDDKAVLKSSSIYKLCPMLTLEEGKIQVMRYYTRLQRGTDIPREVKFPIILHRRSWVTKLIVRYYHEMESHDLGVNYTLNHLRERYWIPHARELIKEVQRECPKCRLKFRVKTGNQQMGPLPPFRITKTLQTFSDCSVDYGGPYLTIQGRGKVRAKRYLCLFVCLQTRSVHLEMAYSLEADGFLKALRRMTARRGWPKRMVSDNGTNFVGASRELREQLLDRLDRNKVEKDTAQYKIQWEWNPPRAPHFGGVFEAMIKSAKRAIAALLSNAEVNDEELSTIFISVENLLNSRPLAVPSNNPYDEPPITPNHFLIGRIGRDITLEEDDEAVHHPHKRWLRIQQLVRQVWNRWHKEFVPYLGSRSKWIKPKQNFVPGDIVLVIEPKEAKQGWRLGKIERVYPGADGLVRKADVRVKDQILQNRAITNLCPLDFVRSEEG